METINTTLEHFDNIISQYEDPRTKDWFMMSSPITILAITLCYWLFVTVIGPKYMEKRKPYKLKIFLFIYNLIQVVFSFYIFYGLGTIGWFGSYNYRCQLNTESTSAETFRGIKLGYFYFLSKFVELIDTIVFILRKKQNQVTPLHIYHHGIMPLSTWMCVKFAPEGNSTLAPFLNSFVHVVMYFYYLLSGLGPGVQKYLWWKKYLTSLQLIQFAVVIAHSAQSLASGCNYSKLIMWYMVSQSVVFFYLFFNFYKKAYIKNTKISRNNKIE